MNSSSSTIIYEPFIARFTGQLATFVASTGIRYRFQNPCPRIAKGYGYMMAIDRVANRIRIIPVISPFWR